MRIIHVSDFYLPRLGGIETQVAGLAAHQRAAGHEVTVLTATPAGRRTGLPGAPADGDVPVLRTGGLGRLGIVPGDVYRVLLAHADVVHVHLGGVAPLGWAVLKSRGEAGLPTVVTVHSVLDRMHLLHRVAGALGGWQRAPIVWSGVSQHVSEQLRELLGAGATLHVIPNAVDQDRWRPTAAPALARTGGPTGTWLLPEPEPVREVLVVAALRHTRRKRAEALPAILAQAAQHVERLAGERGITPPRLRAVIAGSGNRTPALRRGLAAAGVAGWVDLPGRLTQPELRDLYHRADICVAPTILESFGLSVLEARAAGLPVVARADSGSGEVLEAGREGLLVDSDEEMARAVAELVVDHELRLAITRHNQDVRVAFDWAATLGLTEHAYAAAALLTGRPSPQRPIQAAAQARLPVALP